MKNWRRTRWISSRINSWIIISGMAILVFFWPMLTMAAQIDDVSPREIAVLEKVVIQGSDFGTRVGKVCWGRWCLNRSAIQSWNDTEIVFWVNTRNMDVQGTLRVEYWDTCAYKISDVCIADFTQITGPTIYVKPFIEKLVLNGKSYIVSEDLTMVLKEGEGVEIYGAYFGESQGYVAFGNTSSEVTTWSATRLLTKVPYAEEAAETMTVSNSDGESSKIAVYVSKRFTNDPYVADQYYLTRIKVPQAWKKFAARGQGITVAVIDSGLNWNHEDLIGNIALNSDEIPNNGIDDDQNKYVDDYYGYNFVDGNGSPDPYQGHGSMVAGIIAAKANNNLGIAGIAPEAKIMPLTACSKACQKDMVMEAIYYAVDNGARVINLSLGGLGSFFDFDSDFDRAISYAYDHGVVVVTAAGNGDYISQQTGNSYGRNLNNAPNSPICNDLGYNASIGVTSIEYNLAKSAYADYGKNCIDSAAFGSNVLSLSHPAFSKSGIEYDVSSGTSFAAPQVSAAVALLLSKSPNLTPWEVASYIQNSGLAANNANELSFRGQLGQTLDVEALLTYRPGPNTFPQIVISDVRRDGNYLVVQGNYFSKDVSLSLGYKSEAPGGASTFVSFRNSYVSPREARVFAKKIKIAAGKSVNVRIYRGDGSSSELNSVAWPFGTLLPESGSGSNVDKLPFPKGPANTANFWDLNAAHKNFTAISYVASEKIMNGYADGSFLPNQGLNRAELLKILVTAQKLQPALLDYHDCFPDVDQEWFAPYVCFAKAKGWVQGYQDGTFRPAQLVTKVEALKMLLVSKKVIIPVALYAKPFSDVQLDAWYAPYVYKAQELGILEEIGRFFKPLQKISRAGIAEIIYRLLLRSEVR